MITRKEDEKWLVVEFVCIYEKFEVVKMYSTSVQSWINKKR